MKKRIVSLALIGVLTGALVFGASVNSTTVYAQESDNQEVLENDNEICDNESDEDIVFSAAKAAANTYTREVSEYDMLKAAQKASNVELKNNGFTEADIIALKKPLKGKEHYGKVMYTISCLKFTPKKDQTDLKTKMTWSWSKEPAALVTDIAATTTSENFTKDSSSATVKYYKYGHKDQGVTSQNAIVKTKDAGRGVFTRITMGKNWDTDKKRYKNVAMAGSITTSWSIGKKVTQVGIASNYGHIVVSAAPTPSVSFGGGASISFAPKLVCRSGDEAYKKVVQK